MENQQNQVDYQDSSEVVIDSRIISKFQLHKLAENGGAIKFNNFGLRITYNDNNPASFLIEAK